MACFRSSTSSDNFFSRSSFLSCFSIVFIDSLISLKCLSHVVHSIFPVSTRAQLRSSTLAIALSRHIVVDRVDIKFQIFNGLFHKRFQFGLLKLVMIQFSFAACRVGWYEVSQSRRHDFKRGGTGILYLWCSTGSVLCPFFFYFYAFYASFRTS